MFVLVLLIYIEDDRCYVRLRVRVSVRAYSPHNLHRTGHIKNEKQCIVGLRSVAFSLVPLGLS